MSESPVIREYVKPLPRMRVAKECYNLLHQADPESRVSLGYIRAISKSGVIPVHKVGARILINYDALLEYLNAPESSPLIPSGYGTIRRVGR